MVHIVAGVLAFASLCIWSSSFLSWVGIDTVASFRKSNPTQEFG